MREKNRSNNLFSAESDLKAVKRTKVYQEIAEQIMRLIEAGKLKHGDQLPPERRLAEIFQFRRMIELDQAFHIALARAIRNGTLLKVVERLNDILSESRGKVSRNPDRMELSVAGHANILRAVARGDSEAALAAMEEHLLQVEEIALKGRQIG